VKVNFCSARLEPAIALGRGSAAPTCFAVTDVHVRRSFRQHDSSVIAAFRPSISLAVLNCKTWYPAADAETEEMQDRVPGDRPFVEQNASSPPASVNSFVASRLIERERIPGRCLKPYFQHCATQRSASDAVTVFQ